MSLKTYSEQIAEHIQFLRTQGLDVDQLDVTSQFVRCRHIDQTKGRGELVYKTTQSKLDNGYVGLATWCRRLGEIEETLKTYGLGPDETDQTSFQCSASSVERVSDHEAVAKKAYGFWQHSNTVGSSDYLERKHVGAYGVRFRESEKYGKVLVVPMLDVEGRLWNYQIINPDGSKRDAKGGRIEGLFFFLRPIVRDSLIGVAESYSTAATCMEATDVCCACCFGCNNLGPTIRSLVDRYAESRVVIFADNDRHLSSNQGVLKALEAQKISTDRVSVAVPDFGEIEPSKDASDWNDLAGLRGVDEVKRQLSAYLEIKGI